MSYYEGLHCPVCNQLFADEDDIVVCPKCGLPHHRACWKSVGKCFFDERHGTPDQWSRERASENDPEDLEDDAEDIGKVCPHCGASNLEYAEYCARCGMPISEVDWKSNPPHSDKPPVREYTPYDRYQPFNNPQEVIGDCRADELAAVVGNNVQYYIPRFREIAQGRSGGWNWAAFLFGPFWLFYRKQFGLGLLYFAVLLLSNISFAIVYAPVQYAENEAAAQAAMMQVMDNPLFYFVFALSFIFLVMKIVLGIKGNDFYSEFCSKKIGKAKEETPDLTAAEMKSLGGVSMGLALLSYVLSSLLIEFVTMLTL